MNGNRLWVIVASAAIVGVLALGWVLGVSPLLAQASAADQQRLGVEAQNYAYDAQLVEMKAINDRLPEIEAELVDLQVSVPDTVDLDNFFESVSGFAAASGVTIESITAAEAGLYGSATVDPNAGGETATDPAAAGVYTVPISISVKGQPDQSLAFVAALQNAPRLFLITNVDVTSGADPTGDLTGYLYVIPADVPSEPQPAG